MERYEAHQGHLEQIKDRLAVFDEFLSESVCDELVEFANSYDHAFKDRSTYQVNPGFKEEPGKYNSCMILPEYYPKLWNNCVEGLEVQGIPVHSAVINKYEKGCYIPPHRDKQMAIHTVTVPLQTDPNNYLMFGDPKAYYDNIPIEESVTEGLAMAYPDKKGRGYSFHGNIPIHWVPPVNSLRYSVICLCGARLE